MQLKHTTQAHRVKSAVLLRGWTATEIAAELGISRSMVSALLAGRKRTARWQRRIAAMLGVDVAELWGELLSDRIKRGLE